MGTLIEISQNLASHSLVSTSRSSHTVIACERWQICQEIKKAYRLEVCLGLLWISIWVCPNYELESHHVLSPTHITLGKPWQNSKLNCLQIFCGAKPTSPSKKQQKHHYNSVEITKDSSTSLLLYPHTHQKGSIPASLNWRITTGSKSKDIKVLMGGERLF